MSEKQLQNKLQHLLTFYQAIEHVNIFKIVYNFFSADNLMARVLCYGPISIYYNRYDWFLSRYAAIVQHVDFDDLVVWGLWYKDALQKDSTMLKSIFICECLLKINAIRYSSV